MNAIESDESRRPLLIVTYRGLASTVEFEAFLSRVGDWLARKERYFLVFDRSMADMPTAIQRRRMAEWTTWRCAELGRFCGGAAFVITSPLIHGAFRAVLWLQQLPYPYVVVATQSEGVAWCRHQLDTTSTPARPA